MPFVVIENKMVKLDSPDVHIELDPPKRWNIKTYW